MMSGSKFDRAALPSPRIFYEQELGKSSRPSRGWARSRCPFHSGDNPSAFSVNLETGGFFCFACGARGGDIIAFVQQRYGLEFVSACKKLGIWKEGPGISRIELQGLKRHRELEEQQVDSIAEKIRQLRLHYRDEIHSLERTQRVISELMRDSSLAPEELEQCWSVLAFCVPQLREARAAYYILSFATIGERIDFASRPEERDAAILAIINRGTVRDDDGFVMEVDLSIGQPDARGHGMELTFP